MSDSSLSDSSDLDDIAEYEMIMEINNEDQDEVEAVRMRRYINRERDVAEERLMADYFGPHPKYPAEYFRRRYRMNRELFLKIVQGIENYIQTVNPLPKHFQFFTIRYDCTGLKSFSVIMKCISAIRQLAYGTTPDALDGYLQMRAHCARDCLDYFCMCVIDLYQPEFLRKPTLDDIQNLHAAHNRIHGFPGMLGSIDCMHWEWVNCPKSWHGQYGRGANNDITESARKDVERAFGVLQGRWRIIAQPARAWTVNKLRRIMYTCIILHNMILKNQRYAISEAGEIYICPQQNILRTWVERCAIRQRKAKELRDKQTHSRLQRSLIEHIWALHQP
ncbi:putative nuclease HARBI1 isoform X2 [Tanacetum coccineum]